MFSGIIKRLAEVAEFRKLSSGAELSLRLPGKKGVKAGSSIAINGVCLTVTQLKKCCAQFDLSLETLSRTNLRFLKKSDLVNVERPLKRDDEIGGHFVMGHVDATTEILSVKKQGDYKVFWFRIPRHLSAYLVEKGAVAVDGISLTIVDAKRDRFSCAIVPYTLRNTTLGFKKRGDLVNIEIDILAKYAKKVLTSCSSSITKDFLKLAGFIPC